MFQLLWIIKIKIKLKLSAKVTKLQSDLDEEKELNKCLSSNQEVYQKKLTTLEETIKKTNQQKDNEIKELQSQLRDIMFYLDAQNKINDMKDKVTNDEIQSSQLVVVQDESANTSGASGTSNRRRKKKWLFYNNTIFNN